MFVTIAAIAVLFSGCSDDRKPYLTSPQISLAVGESRDILPYIYFPPNSERTVSLSCADECVSVDGTRISGKAQGRAEVTVHIAGVVAKLTVCVTNNPPTGLYLEIDGKTEQTVNAVSAISPITFTVRCDWDDVGDELSWTCNGQALSGGQTLVFTPNGYGEFILRAALGGLYAERTVRVYRPTAVSASFAGELEQGGNYTPVAFLATEENNPLNPRSDFAWSVNGEVTGRSAVFEFLPKAAGEYRISLEVNGVVTRINGMEAVVVTAGARAPRGEVEFDDRNGVYVVWRDGEHIARATVVSPDGTRKNIDRSDAQYSYLFKKGMLDVTQFVDVCAQTPREYRITLVADGACETTFMQYPVTAKAFLDETVFAYNSFISGEADCARWIEELYVTNASSGRAYVGRGAGNVEQAIRNKAAELGLDIAVELTGNVVSVSFDDYETVPTEHADTSVTRMFSELPHIDYGMHSRSDDYVFALDRQTKSVAVSTSEQLLYAAKYGLKPICAANSTAKLIYDGAKLRLRYIVGASYDAWQKVHAIYDYLQWVAFEADNPTVSDSSRFLESIFGSVEIAPPSNRDMSAVTSEGAAKAVLLLCKTEGIDCIIQRTEKAGDTYYFNKVKLDGLWYNVDVLGGKVGSDALGIHRLSALNAHKALLIDDKSARALGLDPYGGEYSATDGGAGYYLKKHVEGEYFDFYISSEEKDDYNALCAAVYYAFDGALSGTVELPVFGVFIKYSVEKLGAEFMLGDGMTEKDIQKIYTFIERAVTEYIKERYDADLAEDSVTVHRAGNNIHVIVSLPRKGLGEA